MNSIQSTQPLSNLHSCFIAAGMLALSFAGMGASSAWADQALATSKNCLACHAIDRKVVGPSFKEVAAKYANDKTAADRMAYKIIKGGVGAWGAVPMPANPQVSDAESKKLAAWLLSLK